MTAVFIISTVLSLFAAFCCLVWFCFNGWKPYRLDLARQRIFKIRNELFDKAASGQISFEDEAYGMVRTTLNGAIRFLHDLSFWRFILFVGFSHGAERTKAMRLRLLRRERALNALPAERKLVYEKALGELHSAILIYMAESSVFMFSVVHVLIFISRTKDLIGRVQSISRIQSQLKILDTEAAIIGAAS